MKTQLLTLLLLISSIFASANIDCIYKSQKAGITVSYVATCDFENQSIVDSIVNTAVAQLNRQDTSLKVLVFVNHRHLSFPGSNIANFFSIAFDTLREIDHDYVFDYYWNLASISMKENAGPNKFRSQDAPIDINSTKNRKTPKEVGVKIIYSVDYNLGEPNCGDLIKAIVYAVRNSDSLKSQQRRDTVRYNTNGWFVSLLTIDTFAINKIIGRKNDFGEKEIVLKKDKVNINYWILGLLGLTAIGVVTYLLRRTAANI